MTAKPDVWPDLVIAIENKANLINRQRISQGQPPLPFALHAVRTLVSRLSAAKRPVPTWSVEENGFVMLEWRRRDARAVALFTPKGRAMLGVETDGTALAHYDGDWSEGVDTTGFLKELDEFTPLKQVIVIRRDLKMRQGKAVSQGSHASGEFMKQQLLAALRGEPITLSSDEIEWMEGGMAKITVRTDTPEQFDQIADAVREAGLKIHIITDAGHTEFHGVPTVTVMAIGPTREAFIDPFTKGLTLL